MKKFLLSILSVVAVAIAGYAEESTVTFDFATLFGTEASVSNIQDLDPLVVDGFTMTFGKGNGSSGITYNKEGNIRLNGSSTSKTEVDGNTVTIAAPEGKVITGIVLNPGTTYNYFSTLIADQGNITSQGNNVAAYWDGYAQTVVLTACRNKFDPSQATTSRRRDRRGRGPRARQILLEQRMRRHICRLSVERDHVPLSRGARSACPQSLPVKVISNSLEAVIASSKNIS